MQHCQKNKPREQAFYTTPSKSGSVTAISTLYYQIGTTEFDLQIIKLSEIRYHPTFDINTLSRFANNQSLEAWVHTLINPSGWSCFIFLFTLHINKYNEAVRTSTYPSAWWVARVVFEDGAVMLKIKYCGLTLTPLTLSASRGRIMDGYQCQQQWRKEFPLLFTYFAQLI